MARLPDAPRTPETQEFFDMDLERRGLIQNTTKVMAHCPDILRQAKQLGSVLRQTDQIPERLQALLNLLVARRNGCPF